MNNNNKIPVIVYYDTESKIVSADYRGKDNLHICIDEDGHVVIRSLKGEKEFKKIKIQPENFKYIKFNPLNDFQYFICTDSYFKIYDIRNNFEMDSVEQFANSIDIFNDSKNYLLVKQSEINLFHFNTHKVEKLKEWNNFGTLSHANMNSVNYCDPEIILLGNENGDLFYSN